MMEMPPKKNGKMRSNKELLKDCFMRDSAVGNEDFATRIHVLEAYADDFGVDLTPAFDVGPARLGQCVTTGSVHVLLYAVLTVRAVREGENFYPIVSYGAGADGGFHLCHIDTIQDTEGLWGLEWTLSQVSTVFRSKS